MLLTMLYQLSQILLSLLEITVLLPLNVFKWNAFEFSHRVGFPPLNTFALL